MMIVDANIATYWLVPSPFHKPANTIAERLDLRAPNFIRVETASALLKYLRAGKINVEQFRDSFDILEGAIFEFVDDHDLLVAASELAIGHNHKIYDCLYLALAIERREPLATADRRLAGLAQKLNIETQLIEPAL